jgi:hypothetical protein
MVGPTVHIRFDELYDAPFHKALDTAVDEVASAGFALDSPDAAQRVEQLLHAAGFPGAAIDYSRSVDEVLNGEADWLVRRDGRPRNAPNSRPSAARSIAQQEKQTGGMSMTRSNGTVAVYESLEEAERAVRRLDEHGFPVANISIVARDLTSERDVRGFVSAKDVAWQGAGLGGWIGGAFGLLLGAAFVWIPGFGPLLVAGPIAAMILGGIEGAAVGVAGGGLLGGLIGLGMSGRHILKYEDHIRGGRYLVIASGTSAEVSQAESILRGGTHIALDQYGSEAADGRP